MTSSASDSSVQRQAELWILDAVASQIGVPLVPGGTVTPRHTAGSAVVEIDGVSVDGSVLIDVFAHQGPLKGGQLHKISTDALKLTTVAADWTPRPRLILALADPTAAASLMGVGWRAEALRLHGIEVLVADLTEAQRAGIHAVQVRQRMVNPHQGADHANGPSLI